MFTQDFFLTTLLNEISEVGEHSEVPSVHIKTYAGARPTGNSPRTILAFLLISVVLSSCRSERPSWFFEERQVMAPIDLSNGAWCHSPQFIYVTTNIDHADTRTEPTSLSGLHTHLSSYVETRGGELWLGPISNAGVTEVLSDLPRDATPRRDQILGEHFDGVPDRQRRAYSVTRPTGHFVVATAQAEPFDTIHLDTTSGRGMWTFIQRHDWLLRSGGQPFSDIYGASALLLCRTADVRKLFSQVDARPDRAPR